MKPAPFAYDAPGSLAEALALLAADDEARPLAGGQSLVPMLALRLARPTRLIDLNRIDGLSGIAFAAGALRIGAMTRQADVLASPLVARHAPLLVHALAHVGHPPTRARGTIGGSLAHADPAAELPVAAVALEATMVAVGAAGERRMAAADFFRGAFDTALGRGEILAGIEIPAQAGGSAFEEIALRKGDFAVASAAARVALTTQGRIAACSIVLGGVAEAPLRCTRSAQLLVGSTGDGDAVEQALAALPLDRVDMDTRVASRPYRRRVAPVLARRALQAALHRAAEDRP